MNINSNNNISFGAKTPNLAGFITAMTKADALAPIVALEATVTGGRTIQAYKRGGKEEARERLIEETTGAIVWLWGVKVLNEVGDTLLSKYLRKAKDKKTFDVGTDKVLRKPFDNFMSKEVKGISPNKVAALKGLKVISSILIANLFIGFVVPRINHYITNTIRHDKHEREAAEQKKQLNNHNSLEINSQESVNPAFKGAGFAALNAFTNAIENTHTGQLLSTDFGIAGGRMVNARTKEERNEIAFRDLGSIYFYMWARGHVGNLLNLAESGRATRLDPETTNILTEHFEKVLESKGGSLDVNEFKQIALGKNEKDIILPKEIKLESADLSIFDKAANLFRKTKTEPLQVAKVKDLETIFDNADIMERIREMSKLQPDRNGEAVVTKQQIIDAVNISEINSPKLLNNAFDNHTGGAYKDPYKFVSNKSLYKLKGKMEDYISDICKEAKDGKITKDVLNKAKKKNIMYNGLNFATGFGIAALFLSTLIPKMQYYITRKKTGVDAFPGTYDYVHHKEMDA